MTIKEWQDKFRKLVIEMEQDLGGYMPRVTIRKRKQSSYEYTSSYPMAQSVAVDYLVEIEFGE